MNKLLIILIGSLLLIAGCKSKEKASRKPLEGKNSSFLQEKLENYPTKFKTLSMRAAMSFSDEKQKLSFKSVIRIQKDSAIWVSITPLFGIEMARVLITQDSVKVMDRLNGKYFAGDFNYLSQKYKVDADYEILEAMFTGRPIPYEKNEKLSFSVDKELYYLGDLKRRKLKKADQKPERIKADQILSYWIYPENYLIAKMLFSDLEKNREVEAHYRELLPVQERMFPHDLEFLLKAEKEARLEIEYSKVIFDEEVHFSFNIPSKYERIEP